MAVIQFILYIFAIIASNALTSFGKMESSENLLKLPSVQEILNGLHPNTKQTNTVQNNFNKAFHTNNAENQKLLNYETDPNVNQFNLLRNNLDKPFHQMLQRPVNDEVTIAKHINDVQKPMSAHFKQQQVTSNVNTDHKPNTKTSLYHFEKQHSKAYEYYSHMQQRPIKINDKNTNTKHLNKVQNKTIEPMSIHVKQQKGTSNLSIKYNFNNTPLFVKQHYNTIQSKFNEPASGGPGVKQGSFKLPNNQGEGTYSISSGEVYIKVKMKLKKVKTTKPTTKPTTSATAPPTTITTSPTTAPVTTALPITTAPPTSSPTTVQATTSPTLRTTAPTALASTPPPTTAPTAIPTTAATNSTSSPTTQFATITTTRSPPDETGCPDLQLNKQALAAHNKYRATHNAPALLLDCELSKEATAYANTLADLGSPVMSGYSTRPNQGENLAIDCTGNTPTHLANEIVTNWYNEVCKYNFNEDGPQKATDHFTQLVWISSTKFGMGVAQKQEANGGICSYFVARYRPQGDVYDGITGYKDNVLKGSFDESYCNQIKDGAGLDGGYGMKRQRLENSPIV